MKKIMILVNGVLCALCTIHIAMGSSDHSFLQQVTTPRPYESDLRMNVVNLCELNVTHSATIATTILMTYLVGKECIINKKGNPSRMSSIDAFFITLNAILIYRSINAEKWLPINAFNEHQKEVMAQQSCGPFTAPRFDSEHNDQSFLTRLQKPRAYKDDMHIPITKSMHMNLTQIGNIVTASYLAFAGSMCIKESLIDISKNVDMLGFGLLTGLLSTVFTYRALNAEKLSPICFCPEDSYKQNIKETT